MVGKSGGRHLSDLELLGRQGLATPPRRPRNSFARSPQLRTRLVRPGLHSEGIEHVPGCPQVRPRLNYAALPSQPAAVGHLQAGEVERPSRLSVEGGLIEVLRLRIVCE